MRTPEELLAAFEVVSRGGDGVDVEPEEAHFVCGCIREHIEKLRVSPSLLAGLAGYALRVMAAEARYIDELAQQRPEHILEAFLASRPRSSQPARRPLTVQDVLAELGAVQHTIGATIERLRAGPGGGNDSPTYELAGALEAFVAGVDLARTTLLEHASRPQEG